MTPEELIDRLYLELDQLDKKPAVKLPTPNVISQNRKTYLTNFRDICTRLSRTDIELKKWFDDELQEACTLDSNGALVIHRSFKPLEIQKVLANYVTNQVRCKQCKSPNTFMTRENRLNFRNCQNCLSKQAY